MARRAIAPAPAQAGADALAGELDRLAGMNEANLRRRWRTLVGRPAPDGLTPAVILRVLCYRVQANALGDLDRETARALSHMVGEGDAEVIPLPEHRPIKPGTLLVREWAGARYHVMVLADDFAWDGRTFESLSKVAHAITGTKWNGPRFFGLRSPGSQDARRTRR